MDMIRVSVHCLCRSVDTKLVFLALLSLEARIISFSSTWYMYRDIHIALQSYSGNELLVADRNIFCLALCNGVK